MTPEEHNKYLAWSHLAYGGLFFLLMAVLLILFGATFILAIMNDPSTPPVIFFVLIWVFIAAIYFGMTVPSLIAGYALMKRKKSAKIWAIISAVIAAMNFPFGTFVTVYTFWFLFSDPGKYMYEQNYALPPGRQTWANQSWNQETQQQRDAQYHPPPPPPDWR